MSITVPIEKQRLNKIKYSVRASQAIVQYSVGSMVDFPEQTLMPAAPELWENSTERIHDERLEKLLHVKYFGMPGSKDLKQFQDGISYVRFPEWYFCPKCRRLQPITDWIRDYRRLSKKSAENDPYMIRHLNCPKCRVSLVVARIVTVCENGHIDDFPWVEWAHAHSKVPICPDPKMVLFTSSSATEGLEGITVSCESCKARATLKGAFAPDSLKNLDKVTSGQYHCRCRGRHPWKNTREVCTLYPRVMQRGSSSVYFPVVESSLVIPPFSNKDTALIENSEKYKELVSNIDSTLKSFARYGSLTQEMKANIINDNITEYANSIAAGTLIPEDRVVKILERKLLSPEEEPKNENENEEEENTLSLKYKIQEYEALSAETRDVPHDGDFLKEIADISEYNLPYVKSISLIHKVREVEALVGFTRIKPASREDGAKNEPVIVSIKEPETKWYPAYEIRGEGIFIEFDGELINQWIANSPGARERAKHIDEAYRASTKSTGKKTAKYIILHTLSHLLIKQLSFECGYGISSLKERIYCSEKSEGKDMAGIFIYTANGDSEGTLGGLVRQGRADCLPSVFRKALESALICSNDPVCSMSKGQGRDSINLAACYSCALIPETSCERGNLCLDRGVLVGTFADRNTGIFSAYLNGEQSWKNPEGEIEKTHSTIINSVTGTSEKPSGMGGTELNSSAVSRITLKLEQKGLDLKQTDYSVIWQQFEIYAETDAEKALYRELVTKSNLFRGTEKPYRDAVFSVEETGEKIQCDLYWEKAELLFFSEYGDDDYETAKESKMKCVSVRDGASAIEVLLSRLSR